MPYDATEYIQRSIDEVMLTIGIALVVVVVVIFLFLGSLRSLLIPAIAIPLSIVGGGMFMIASGFSINLLTLLAVVLAIGLVVDDAIIVVENVHRHIEDGLTPLEAARLGARELASPIIVMATTLAAVFAPIGLTGGLTGSLFSEFAFTLVFTVAVSAVVALTLSPMVSSRVLRHTPPRGLAHALEAGYARLRAVYDRSLGAVMRHRAAVLVVALGVFVAIPVMFLGTPSELAPIEDQGLILVSAKGPPTATLHFLDRYSDQIRSIMDGFPENKQVFEINGLSLGGGGGYNGMIAGMKMVDWSKRKRTPDAAAAAVAGQACRPDRGAGGGVREAFVAGFADRLPGAVRAHLERRLRHHREGRQRFHRQGDAKRRLRIPHQGPRLRQSRGAGEDRPCAGGRPRHHHGRPGRQPRAAAERQLRQPLQPERPQLRGDSAGARPVPRRARRELRDYYVRDAAGGLVPLSTLISVHTRVTPEFLPQMQQLNSATIQGVMAPGVTLGQALDDLHALAAKTLPSDFGTDTAGQSRQYAEQGHAFLVTFALSIVLVYLLLAAQFESFRDPLIVMVTVPMAISGALAFMYLGAATLNIYTEVGLVTLIGLITKQGILIVQFANVIQETEGLDRAAAVLKASSIRLRPILMTTGAMVFGAVPLILASGPGSVSRFDMGLVICSGLAIGALFSLYVVPAIYTYLAADKSAAREA